MNYYKECLYWSSLTLLLFVSPNILAQQCSNNAVRQTYFIPYEEDETFDFIQSINPGINNGCWTEDCQNPAYDQYNSVNPISKYVSINVLGSNTIIYYDHWEDGYEFDPDIAVTQSTTEIWGDGDPSNGSPPGVPSDVFSPGDVIVLDMTITTPNTASTIELDGRDKLSSTKNILMSAATWSAGSNTLLAGASAVLSVDDYSTDFIIPVGEDQNTYNLFSYTGLFFQASEDHTVVNIDTDNNGIDDLTVTLNEGETHFINGGIQTGATVSSNFPIAATLVTGDPCDLHEARFFKLDGEEKISNAYINPVATPSDQATVVHLYNPSSSPIMIDYTFYPSGAQPQISLGPMASTFVTVPNLSGSRFYSTDDFMALVTIDSGPESNVNCFSDGTRGNHVNDWGFTMIPESSLKGQVLGAAWAAGQDPTYTGSSTENSAPIWVTAIHSTTSTAPIQICVDYNGDGGSMTDALGNSFDMSFSLAELQSERLYDPDGDQTAMSIWVCDGSEAIVSAVWGQDPNTASGGSPAIDVGTALLGGVAFESTKLGGIFMDDNNDGLLNIGESMEYCICVSNVGKLNYAENALSVIDTLSPFFSYVPNSTYYEINGQSTIVNDDATPNSLFPADETGWYFPEILEIGEAFTLCYQTELTEVPPADQDFIENIACISDGVDNQKPDINIPLGCEIEITDTNTSTCDEGQFELTATITWYRPPANTDLIVSYQGMSQTINVSGGVSSPHTVTFTAMADGMSYDLVAAFTQDCRVSTDIDAAEPCDPELTLSKSVNSVVDLGGNNYEITYLISVSNVGDAAGIYSLVDTPGYDDDVMITSANYSDHLGNSSSLDITSSTWNLNSNVNLPIGQQHDYIIEVSVSIDLSDGLGNEILTDCSMTDPSTGTGLFNQATVSWEGDDLTDEACPDVPYYVMEKNFISSTQTSANCYIVQYSISVSNTGTASGSYDLSDNPVFDDDITINSVSYDTNVIGNTGGSLVVAQSISIADDQEINVGESHVYTLSFDVCLDLDD